MTSTNNDERSLVKKLSKNASLKLHAELRALGIKYADQLILEGVKQVSMKFFNDFELILKDNKSSKARLKESSINKDTHSSVEEKN